MALLKYLKLKKSPFPNPEGPLSAHVSTKCIDGANEKVYIGVSRASAGRPSLYEIVPILQTAKLFQRNEFHLVTVKDFPLESFAVYGICTYH